MSGFRDPRELRDEARRLNAIANAIEDGTWAVIIDGPGTTVAVAEALDCSIQSASNRLNKLYNLRIIERTQVIVPGGGRRFEYRLALKQVSDD